MVTAELEAFFKTLIIGERVNVMPPGLDEVMVREVTHVGERSEYGKRWLVWRWKVEGQTPWGTTDCGYGGQAIGGLQQVAA